MTIYVLCPSSNYPVGAVRVFYRYVDILNKHGYQAFILHKNPGFRAQWFKNSTKIAYINQHPFFKITRKLLTWNTKHPTNKEIYLLHTPKRKITSEDYLIVPAIEGQKIINIAPGTKKIIFNQGVYYSTFRDVPILSKEYQVPYREEDVVAALVVSEDSKKYLEFVFPNLKIFRHHNSVDPVLFTFEDYKKKQIAFLTSKNTQDIRQVINILRLRGSLEGFDLIPIVNKPQEDVAKILKESYIFLNFGSQEGFGMPPAEAMACGCIVIGYHGRGGIEYFKSEFSYPVEEGDIIGFVKAIEYVIKLIKTNPAELEHKRQEAACFIRRNYSPEREEQDVVEFWKSITSITE